MRHTEPPTFHCEAIDHHKSTLTTFVFLCNWTACFYLRPPLLAEPRALADLDSQPPPPPPLKADDPPLFSYPPQPDALDFSALFEWLDALWPEALELRDGCVLFEFPLQPLPVLLYTLPFAAEYLSPLAV
jgi:hypothetical protein